MEKLEKRKMMKKNRRKKGMGIEWVTVRRAGSIQVGGMEGEKETEEVKRQNCEMVQQRSTNSDISSG